MKALARRLCELNVNVAATTCHAGPQKDRMKTLALILALIGGFTLLFGLLLGCVVREIISSYSVLQPGHSRIGLVR
jgi:hypothetical protein